MLESTPFAEAVVGRMLDFFGARSPWQRRLWQVGSVLAIREALEPSEAVRGGALHQAAFDDLKASLRALCGPDPGVGGVDQRRLLQEKARGQLPYGGHDYVALRELLEAVETGYLGRWSVAVSGSPPPKEEETARAVASHLLDLGFSATYLHHWLTYQVKYNPTELPLADIIEMAGDLAQQPPGEFKILLAFQAAPKTSDPMPAEWRNPSEVSQWLSWNGFGSRDIRQAGGLLLSIEARDEWSAVEKVDQAARGLAARVTIGSPHRLTPLMEVWVEGSQHRHRLTSGRRMVEVHSLSREGVLYSLGQPSRFDEVIELLQVLEDGAPGPAVASGWAAIEALLIAPGEGVDRVLAADRLACLVAGSLPRAELTTLAYRHAEQANDDLAKEISTSTTNLNRANLVASAILRSQGLALSSQSDKCALTRMAQLLAGPRAYLAEARKQVAVALRRLYRHRNLVMHWGRVGGVAVHSCLRTAAPLVGAGADRIAHAWLRTGTQPLELAARAALRLSLLETESAKPVTELLE